MRQDTHQALLEMLKKLFIEHTENEKEPHEFGESFVTTNGNDTLVVVAAWVSHKLAPVLMDALETDIVVYNEAITNTETYIIEIQKNVFVIVTEIRLATPIAKIDWIEKMQDFAGNINNNLCMRYSTNFHLAALKNDLYGTIKTFEKYFTQEGSESYDPD